MRITDPEGVRIDRYLDARGEVLAEIVLDASNAPILTSRYHYEGPWVTREEVEEGAWQRTTTSTYDDRGRPLQESEQWARGSDSYAYSRATAWTGRTAQVFEDLGPGRQTSRTIELDGLGNLIRHTQGGVTDRWTFGSDGLLTEERPAGLAQTTHSYDQGLLTATKLHTTPPEESTFTYYLDGRLHTSTDPSGRTMTVTWTHLGLPKDVTHGIGSEVERTSRTYDPAGNPLTLTKGAGTTDARTWTYSHGPRGELLSVSLPGGIGTYEYAYDKSLRLTSVKTPGGPETTYQYDALGRPTERKRGASRWLTSWHSGESRMGEPAEGSDLPNEIRTVLDGRGRPARVQYLPGTHSQGLGV